MNGMRLLVVFTFASAIAGTLNGLGYSLIASFLISIAGGLAIDAFLAWRLRRGP